MKEKSDRLKEEIDRNAALEDQVAHMVWDMLLQYDVVTLTHILLGGYYGTLEEE